MLHRSLFAFACLLLASGHASAQNMPAKLVPPEGSTLIGKYTAEGSQIYVCNATGAAQEWTFKAPEAVLADEHGNAFAKHYAGPTWEAPDGSKIVGKATASEPAPKAGDIPWLLMTATPSGTGVLSNARFVQRIDTSGGVGPTGACPMAGTERRVAYTAVYAIYK